MRGLREGDLYSARCTGIKLINRSPKPLIQSLRGQPDRRLQTVPQVIDPRKLKIGLLVLLSYY